MVIPFPGETEERNGQAEAGGWVPQGVRGREVRIDTPSASASAMPPRRRTACPPGVQHD